MQEIEIRFMSTDEAKALTESSFGKMRSALLDLGKILDKLVVKDVLLNDNIIHSSLDEIRSNVASLQEYISVNQSETLDRTNMSQCAGEIVELFMQLDLDPSRDIMLREIIIRAETSAVLANAHAREIMAVDRVLKKQPYFENWTVDA